MARSLLNVLATRFASLSGVSEHTEEIHRLLWAAHDLAADDLDGSERAISALVIALEMAEREVGAGPVYEAAVVRPRFGPTVLMLTRGPRGDT